MPRLSSLGGGFGPDSDLPSFAARGDGNCSVEKKSSPYIVHSKEVIQLLGGQAKSRKNFRLCRNTRDFHFFGLTSGCVFGGVGFQGRNVQVWGSCSRTNTRLLRVELVVPAPTFYSSFSVLSTPVVSHFGSTFGLRPRLFVVEAKLRPGVPVTHLWRLAESVERFLTQPFQHIWRRFCASTSRRGARVPTWSECRAECRVRCPRGVNNFPLTSHFSPLTAFTPTLSNFRLKLQPPP